MSSSTKSAKHRVNPAFRRVAKAAEQLGKTRDRAVAARVEAVIEKHPKFLQLQKNIHDIKDRLHDNRVVRTRKNFSIAFLTKQIQENVLETKLKSVQKERSRLDSEIAEDEKKLAQAEGSISKLAEEIRAEVSGEVEAELGRILPAAIPAPHNGVPAN